MNIVKKKSNNPDLNDYIKEIISLKKDINILIQENKKHYESQCDIQNICVICLESLQNTDFLSLYCKHKYHINCMVRVMVSCKPLCPLCRNKIKLPKILEELESKNNEIRDLKDQNLILIQENARYEYLLERFIDMDEEY